MTKYIVKFQNWDDPMVIKTISEHKTYNAARKSLNKELKDNNYILTDDKWSDKYIRAGYIPGILVYIYWIEDDKGNKLPLNYKEEDKVSAKTINNQSNQIINKTKTKTVMANQSKGLKIGTTKSGKAVYGNAKVSSAYRATGTKNKKPAMVVPVGYVTLPSPFYTFGRKHQNLGKKGGYERVRTYVIGATMTKNSKKMYIVAQLSYMGGKPAVAENRYKGYSRYTAWNVFNEIPYTTKSIKDANGKWKESKSDGTSASAVQEAIAQRKAIAAARARSKK